MQKYNLHHVSFQTVCLGNFKGSLADFYEDDSFMRTLSAFWLVRAPVIGQLELKDDCSLGGSFLIQLPGMEEVEEVWVAISTIFAIQAWGGCETFSPENGYTKGQFFIKKNVCLNKEDYKIQEGGIYLLERRTENESGLFYISLK